MSRAVMIPVGVVIARETAQHTWDGVRWRPVDVLIDAPCVEWREVRRGPGFVHYHAATLGLELDERQVTAYRVNLANGVPSVYVGYQQHPAGGNEMPVLVRSVSVSPFDARTERSAGFQMIERVPMPPLLVSRVQDFIAAHTREGMPAKIGRLGTDFGFNLDSLKFGEIVQGK